MPQWRHFLQRMGEAAAADEANPYAEVQQELLSIAEVWINSTGPVAGLSGEGPITVSRLMYQRYGKCWSERRCGR